MTIVLAEVLEPARSTDWTWSSAGPVYQLVLLALIIGSITWWRRRRRRPAHPSPRDD